VQEVAFVDDHVTKTAAPLNTEFELTVTVTVGAGGGEGVTVITEDSQPLKVYPGVPGTWQQILNSFPPAVSMPYDGEIIAEPAGLPLMIVSSAASFAEHTAEEAV